MAEVITEFSSRFNAQMPRAAPYFVRVAFLMRARRSAQFEANRGSYFDVWKQPVDHPGFHGPRGHPDVVG